MNIPSKIQAGDTVAWTDSLASYPATSWTLAYTLYRATQSPVTFPGTPSGSDYSFALTAAQTGALSPGEWMWSAKVTNAESPTPTGEIKTVESGSVNVKPDYSSATPSSDFRGPATIAYENVLAAINTGAAQAAVTVTVGGRSVTYRGMDELVKAEQILRPRMEAEMAAASGVSVSKLVRAQFGRG